MRVCSEEEWKIVVDGVELKEVEQSGTEEDILARIQKARASFAILSQIWKSSVYGKLTKLILQCHSQVVVVVVFQ
jgi:hypothetical protein